MVNAKVAGLLVIGLLPMLPACTTIPEPSPETYSEQANAPLYQVQRWSLDGRLALTGKQDAWQASINWTHEPSSDAIKLAGPLGQGATNIFLTKDFVTIDRGAGKVQTSSQPEDFISQQVGLFVPVRSLRYWVVGLPEPDIAYLGTNAGFTQSGWLIEYGPMQAVDNKRMPRKLTVSNPQVKLKLIIEQWVINDAR